MDVEKRICPMCANICLGNVYYTAGFKRWQCQMCGNEFRQSASASIGDEVMILKKKRELNSEDVESIKELIKTLKENLNERIDVLEAENEKLLCVVKRLLIGEECNMDKIINKLQSGEELYEGEIMTLVHKGNIIDEIEHGSTLEDYNSIQTILNIDGQLYQINWQRSLFEYRDHKYLNQPYKVEKIEKVVVEYNPIENN